MPCLRIGRFTRVYPVADVERYESLAQGVHETIVRNNALKAREAARAPLSQHDQSRFLYKARTTWKLHHVSAALAGLVHDRDNAHVHATEHAHKKPDQNDRH